MKKLFFVCLIILVYSGIQAQHQLYGHYLFNKALINPAMAGFKGKAGVILGHRNQWQQIDGAPTTTVLSGELAFNRVGVGFNTVMEEIGPYRFLNADINYNYKIPVSNGTLALGVQASIPRYQFVSNDLDAVMDGDNAFSDIPNRSEIQPNFGLGAYYANQLFSLGISMPYLINNIGSDPLVAPIQRNQIFLHADGLIPIAQNIMLKPAALTRFLPGKPLNGELHTHVILMEKYWIGSGYRTDDTWIFSMLVDLKLNIGKHHNIVSLGYAIENPSATTRNARLGLTHEILLRMHLQNPPNRILSPRFLH